MNVRESLARAPHAVPAFDSGFIFVQVKFTGGAKPNASSMQIIVLKYESKSKRDLHHIRCLIKISIA